MPATSLCIERTGKFKVRFSGDNSTQCGIRGKTETLHYIVRIDGDPRHLTREGFIIDNMEIHRYFVEKYAAIGDFKSCEHIAMTACDDLRAMFGRGNLRNVRVKSIRVSVSGNKWAAGITAGWEKRARRSMVA